MKKLKNRKRYITIAIAIIILTSGLIVYAQQEFFGIYPDKAEQIAKLAGMEVEIVMSLYEAAGNWDKLLKNIHVYKELLIMTEDSEAEKALFELIPSYEAPDLYIAFDYFVTNGLPLAQVSDALEQKNKGQNWDIVLKEFSDAKHYRYYKALDSGEIQKLLDQGYLPEDILKADFLAKAKDISVDKVIKAKTPAISWERVAKINGFKDIEYRQVMSTVSKLINKEGNISEILQASKSKAEERRQSDIEEITKELALSNEEMKVFLNQGFNPWEVRNAYKIAQANRISPEEVLARKKTGQDWSEILASYAKK